MTRVVAIKKFFGMTPAQAVREIKELKLADPAGYEWVAQECAKQLGETLE